MSALILPYSTLLLIDLQPRVCYIIHRFFFFSDFFHVYGLLNKNVLRLKHRMNDDINSHLGTAVNKQRSLKNLFENSKYLLILLLFGRW